MGGQSPKTPKPGSKPASVDAAAARAGRALLLALVDALLGRDGPGPVHLLLEDGLVVDRLELGLDVAWHVAAAVGAAARVGRVVGVILDLVALAAPGDTSRSVH